MTKEFDIVKTHVPDKVYAYTLQIRYMLYNLIDALIDDVISVEAYDDNAVESLDGTIDLQQIKSSTSDHNPIANRSTDFWKSFYNWLELLKSDSHLFNKTKFRLIIISAKDHAAGNLIESFSSANNDSDALIVLNQAKDELWGFDLSKKAEIPEKYADHLNELFNTSNQHLVLKIISNFNLSNYSVKFDEELMTKFGDQPIPSEYTLEIFREMLGWLTDECNKQLKCNTPAFITKRDYKEYLTAVIRKYNQDTILKSMSADLSIDGKRSEVQRRSTYIKQLEIVDAPFEVKLDAANSLMRVEHDTAMWAKRGLVIKSSFTEYEEALIRTYDDVKLRNTLTHGALPDEKSGQLLYIDCKQKKFTLQDKNTPDYFTTGYYNMLSNKCNVVGWHPNYLKLLRGDIHESDS